MVKKERIRLLNKAESFSPGGVLYWMSRDQRIEDNYAILYTKELAEKNATFYSIIFNIVPEFLGATIRQYDFMLKGLEELEKKCAEKNIPFYVVMGQPEDTISEFVNKNNIGILITDFSPLRIYTKWKKEVSKKISIPFYEVDAHNIVPCFHASSKQEFAARTIRPKILKLLPDFLEEFPRLPSQRNSTQKNTQISWNEIRKKLKIDFSVKEISWIEPGEKAAEKNLQKFIKEKLETYAEDRNDPSKDGQSNLSPYLHFGQIASQRIALEIQKSSASKKAKEVFLEELIVRKELSDNFCFYNQKYDSIEAFPKWATETLKKHEKDKREFIYSLKEFEFSKTHDDLWNAAQTELVVLGKMHGYMRMYWAKKILEWTKNAADALKIAIYLNDKYELDGRDPNGYVGILWSLAGLHDRPWFDRKIFGTVRYMNYNGAKNKFDIEKYIEKINILKKP